MPRKPSSDKFQIKFNSKDVHPDNIRLSDLVDALGTFENGVLSIVKGSRSDILGTGFGFSLVGVKEGCAAYELKPIGEEGEAVLRPALQELYKAIKSRDKSDVPRPIRKTIETFEDFSTKYKCNSEFRHHASNIKPNAVVRPQRELRLVKDAPLRGETTIYGCVEQVGGADTPVAWLRQADGSRVKIHITREKAPEFGKKLYSWVGLRGNAEWDEDDKQIVYFNLDEILDYIHMPISQAFEALSEEIGDLFENIGNVDDFISDLRRE